MLEALVRQQQAKLDKLSAIAVAQQTQINSLLTRPKSITDYIDEIPGRRIDTWLTGEVNFDANVAGARGNPVTIQVSQDGPFVMTHVPQIVWRPTLPTNATNFGRWRPVSTYPLPDQVVDTDVIDIMWELQDGGSQRNFQNSPRGPLVSRPDNAIPAPVPTLFGPNSAIQIFPTYLKLTWDASTPPTQGTLHIDLIGYRIVNL
jgi:hypothetical protein